MSKRETRLNKDTEIADKKGRKPLFKGEKSLDSAKRENKSRIKSLSRVGSNRAKVLVDKLENCRPKARCNSPACAICNWFTRRRHVRQMRRIFRDSVEKFHVTIVPVGLFFKPRALRQMNVKLIKNTLRKRMERAGLSDALIVGSVEATYKFEGGLVSLHWHLMFGNCTEKDVEKLRSYYLHHRQMHNEAIKPGDENKVFSYGLKNVTFGKDPITRKPKRPAPSVHAKLMYFLDRHSFRELMFMKGVRFNGKKLGVIDKLAIRRKSKGIKRF